MKTVEKPSDRIIVMLDAWNYRSARDTANRLHGFVGLFGFGTPAFTAGWAWEFVRHCDDCGYGGVFYDAKLNDTPNTVHDIAEMVSRPVGVEMFSVHALAGEAALAAAVAGATVGAERSDLKDRCPPAVLAETLLTSLDLPALDRLGLVPSFENDGTEDVEVREQRWLLNLVVKLARLAQDAGCAGVVCSPLEAMVVRAACGPDFLIVTPGVRPSWAATDDEKRFVTPYDAIRAGADYLLVGSPITAHLYPASAALLIAEEIAQATTDATEPSAAATGSN